VAKGEVAGVEVTGTEILTESRKLIIQITIGNKIIFILYFLFPFLSLIASAQYINATINSIIAPTI
ncbi:MAG: hypothetical protein AAB550_03920, partial [Patescibacteria group bacterium]